MGKRGREDDEQLVNVLLILRETRAAELRKPHSVIVAAR